MKIIVITLIGISFVLIGFIGFLFFSNSPGKTSTLQEDLSSQVAPARSTTFPSNSTSQTSVSESVKNESETKGTPSNAFSETPSSEKSQILVKIDDAVSTYSDKGVDQIASLLSSPDLEIREAAIEGMKQLGVPKAASVLREAATKTTTSPEDRAAMLEAADFIELPAYQPESNSNP